MSVGDLYLRSATHDDVFAIARIYVDTWRATYASILPREYLARLDVERKEKTWHRELAISDHVVVAEKDGVIVGFSSGGRERDSDPFFRGEIFTLYVAPGAQRCGVGASLFVEMMRRLLPRSPLIVWVLADNHGARAFYEALGGMLVRTQRETIGGRDVDKVAFAYFDVG